MTSPLFVVVAVVLVVLAVFVLVLHVVDVDVLEVHVVQFEEPGVHWTVEWVAEALSVEWEFSEDGDLHDLGFFVGSNVEEELVPHTLGLTLGEHQVVGESPHLLAVGEGLVALDGLEDLLVVLVAGHVASLEQPGVLAAAVEVVHARFNCNNQKTPLAHSNPKTLFRCNKNTHG